MRVVSSGIGGTGRVLSDIEGLLSGHLTISCRSLYRVRSPSLPAPLAFRHQCQFLDFGPFAGTVWDRRENGGPPVWRGCLSPIRLSPLLLRVLQPFAVAFTCPTFTHVLLLVAGALLATGRRTVTAALRAVGLGEERHVTS